MIIESIVNKKNKTGETSLAGHKKKEGNEQPKKIKRPYKRKPKITVQKSWRGMGHADN